MDFCFKCGSTTDPDWVFCRSCGSGLDESEGEVQTLPVSTASGTPKVELISRGWDDVVEIETVTVPTDPLDGDLLAGPLRVGDIEVTVDSITIIEEGSDSDEQEPVTEPVPVDSWDHLRPHGELPPLQHRHTAPARISRMATLVVALSALVAAALRFYLNTRIDAFGDGRATAQTVDDITMVADVGLLVMLGLAILAGLALVVWFVRAQETANFRPGSGGIVALASGATGIALIAIFFFLEQDTVAGALAANSLIVLGLGLIMASCITTARTVGRIDLKEPA